MFKKIFFISFFISLITNYSFAQKDIYIYATVNNDIITNIERVKGTAGDDTLLGTNNTDSFDGFFTMTNRKYSPFSHKGLFKLDTYFSRRGRRVFEDDQHTQGESTFWEDRSCDFAFGSAQNDWFERHTAQSESIRTRETKHKEVWCYAHWVLMQSKLAVDALCIGC